MRGEGEDREQRKREGRGGKRRQGRWGTQAVAPTEAKSRGAAPKRYRRELPARVSKAVTFVVSNLVAKGL